jgi:hypothetical protein
MIAPRSGARRLPRIIWRHAAKRSMRTLMDFLEASAGGNPKARRKEIEDAIETLRHTPLRCEVVATRDGLAFRRPLVRNRFFVYYIYSPPRGMTSGGTISIRAIKHAASHNPFRDVREPSVSHHPLGVFTTRESTEPATA